MALAIFSLDFEKIILGKEIIEAVERVTRAGNVWKERKVIGDKNLFNLGQRSAYPYEDLKIEVDSDEGLIDPEKKYTSLKVINFYWGADDRPVNYYPVDYDDELIIDTCRKFCDRLKKELQKGIKKLF